MKFEITRTLGFYDDEKPIKNCEEYFYNRVVRHSNDLVMINNELKNDASFFEYLKRNTTPIIGTWDVWYDKFFNEWVKSNENSFNGKMFYEWLLVNYCA